MASPDLAASFAALAAEFAAEPDEQLTSRVIVERIVEMIPDVDEVSLTVRRRRNQHRTLMASGNRAVQADALQYELAEGPCLDAAEGATWVRSGDVGSDPRWPEWGPRAAEIGVRSMLSLQLLQGGRVEGALNLYSLSSQRFADRDVIDLAVVYAMHAANALSAARMATDLQTAISSRHTIGMAQGIAMERFGITQQQSFELLRRLSSTLELKVRDVAAYIVENRTLPG